MSAAADIINDVEEFFGSECIRTLKDKTVDILISKSTDLNEDGVKSLLLDFDGAADIFYGLQTEYLQMEYFQESRYYIEPCT